MSQHDHVIADADGATFLADLNAMALAIVSNNEGASEPSTKYAGMWWPDTTSGWVKQRNTANSAWEKKFPIAKARADVASASTLDLDANAVTSDYLRITGTTTVTAVTLAAGQRRIAVAGGAFQLTNSANLIVQGGANYTTTAGDLLVFFGESSGVVRVFVSKANGSFVADSQYGGHRNKVMNGNFSINQRAVSGTVSLSAGQYGHDRWKAGSSGCTYTFSTSENVTTLNITSGSLVQVVDGNDLQTGNHVLSWVGTAQGKIGSGSFAASGVTGAATGGANLSIEFNSGTLSKVQLEPGLVATAFEHRSRSVEFDMCLSFFERGGDGTTSTADQSFRAAYTGSSFHAVRYSVRKRSAASVIVYSPSTGAADKWRDSSTGADVSATIPTSTVSGFISSASTSDANQYLFTWQASCDL